MKDPTNVRKAGFMAAMAILTAGTTAITAGFLAEKPDREPEKPSQREIAAEKAWAGQRANRIRISCLEQKIERLEAKLEKYESVKHGPAADWLDPLPPDRKVMQ